MNWLLYIFGGIVWVVVGEKVLAITLGKTLYSKTTQWTLRIIALMPWIWVCWKI